MTAVATAVTFVWLGMVLAISFLEIPLKFRAPGVDLRTGLVIGRLVFRALNTAESSLLQRAAQHGHPAARRAVEVTPRSLIRNLATSQHLRLRT
jgi:hypothetical protein